MKVHVIVDGRGNIMGAMAKSDPSPEGDTTVIRPAQEDHRLHELEVSEDVLQLPIEEFHEHLRGHLPKR